MFQAKKRQKIEEPKKSLKDTLKEMMASSLTENMSLSSWKRETVKKTLKAVPNAEKKEVKKLFDHLVTLSKQKGKWTIQFE